jgi:hypothetical protein
MGTLAALRAAGGVTMTTATHSFLARASSWARRHAAATYPGAALLSAMLLSGCTCGEIVDDNFQPWTSESIPYSQLEFVAVDANNVPTGTIYTSTTQGKTCQYVSFDPFAPSGVNVNGTGLGNTGVMIPKGNYYVRMHADVGPVYPTLYWTSPVFHHDYYTMCQDTFTKSNVQCAPYYFQVSQCNTWFCLDHAYTPQTIVHGDYRVIQLINNSTNDGPTGVLRNTW